MAPSLTVSVQDVILNMEELDLSLIHIFLVFLGDRKNLDLNRCKPCRECACKVLDQDTDETLDGTEAYTVDHDRSVLLTVSSDVLKFCLLYTSRCV